MKGNKNKYGYSSSHVDRKDMSDSESIIEFAGTRASAHLWKNIRDIINKPKNLTQTIERVIDINLTPFVFVESLIGGYLGKYKVPLDEVRGTKEYDIKSKKIAGEAIRRISKK